MHYPEQNPLLDAIRNHVRMWEVGPAIDQWIADIVTEVTSIGAPIDLTKVAKKFGISAIEYGPIPCEGTIEPTDSESYRVRINSCSPPSRQRFSLAHEIAHAMLYSLLPELKQFSTRSVFVPPSGKVEERLCDDIAGRLLMPQKILLDEFSGFSIGLSLITEMSQRFASSASASVIRVRQVSGVDLALFRMTENESDGLSFDGCLVNFDSKVIRTRLGDRLVDALIDWRDVDANVSSTTGWVWFQQENVRRRLFVQKSSVKSRLGQRISLAGKVDFSARQL